MKTSFIFFLAGVVLAFGQGLPNGVNLSAAPASNSREAVRETDSATNTAVKSIGGDSRAPTAAGFPTTGLAGSGAKPAQVIKDGADKAAAKSKDDDSSGELTVADSDAENVGDAPNLDHEVEPVVEHGGGESEVRSEDEQGRLSEGGGQGGDAVEANGASESEARLPSASFSETDDEEYDDDVQPLKEGVDSVDIDRAGEAKVTTSEKNAANERPEVPKVDGNGNVDVKPQGTQKDTVDTLNTVANSAATVSASVNGASVTATDNTPAAAAAAAASALASAAASVVANLAPSTDPNAANSAANGNATANSDESTLPPSQRGKRRSPRAVPRVAKELALRKKGLAVLPTAPRRPFPTSNRADTALSFDWRGNFDGKNFIKIPHSSRMLSPAFTISFYLTVTGTETNAWRNILHKGFTNFQRTPSLWLEYGSNRIYAAVSTTVNSDETLTSKTSLIPGIPAHVAYVVSGRKIQIWINGELDAEKRLKGSVVTNTGPLYIGKDPFYAGAKASLHSFRWTQRALRGREIRLNSVRGRHVSQVSFDRKGKFDGSSLSGISVPHDPILATDEFSVCFWTTLHSHSTGRPRCLLHKGFQPSERTPFIEVDEQLNRLNVRISTTADSNEGFYSKSRLRLNQPTHICYVRRDRELSLFVNGRLDTMISTTGTTVHSQGPLFVGNSPFQNGYNGVITGWRWFNTALSRKDVGTIIRATATAPLRIRTSTRLNAKDFIRIPHVPGIMDTPDFTISFWIRPTEGFTGSWRSILHKGVTDTKRTPSIWLNPDSNRLTVEVSTTFTLKSTVRVTSKKNINVNEITHVAVTLQENVLCVIIEGWIDTCETIPGKVKSNRGTLMIGKSPRFPGFAGDISDLRYHPRALSRAEVSPYEMDIPEPVFSYWNPALGDHILSLNRRQFGTGLGGYQVITAGETVGVHGTGEGTPVGYAHNIIGKNLVPLYGYYNDRTGDHWYTTDTGATRPGYTSEGTIMYVFPKDYIQDDTVVPVYEHFNAKLGDSFFTPDPSPGHGYETKGIAFFLHKDGTTAVPVFEFYNPPQDGGSTLELSAVVPFNGWTKMTTSDLGFLSATKDFSVSFWLKLKSGGGGFYRTILHKGAFPEERAPAIYLMPHENRIAVRMSTTSDFNEGMDSRTVIPLHQYTHVVLVSRGNTLQLFINGRLDISRTFTGTRSFNPGNLNIGRFPDSPGVDGTVADFKFFDHLLKIDDVQQLQLGTTASPEIALSYTAPLSAPLVIPNSRVVRSESFTIIIDYQLTAGFTGEERAILWKGNNKDESAPSLVLMPNDNRLMLKLSTSTASGLFVISDTILEVNKNYKIGIVRDGDTISLFINYALDKTLATNGAVLFNNGNLYLIRTPWTGAHTGNLVSFRWYSRSMTLREILQFNDLRERRSAVTFDWRGRLGRFQHVTVPNAPSTMDVTKDFTMSFWVNLDYDTTGPRNAAGFNGPARVWRQAVLKGEQHFQKSPQISIFPETGRVRVMVHKAGNVGEFEKMDSTGTIPAYTSTHIALIRAGPFLRLFLNGILEAEMPSAGMENTDGPLQLGNLAIHVSAFRFMGYALTSSEIFNEVYSVPH